MLNNHSELLEDGASAALDLKFFLGRLFGKFKWLFLNTTCISFHLNCCIRLLWRSLTIFHYITSSTHNHHTDISPLQHFNI